MTYEEFEKWQSKKKKVRPIKKDWFLEQDDETLAKILKKRIKTYALLVNVAMPFVIMSFAIHIIPLLLCIVGDFYYQSESSVFVHVLPVYIGFEIVYLIGFGYCAIRVRFGMITKRWKAMVLRVSNATISDHIPWHAPFVTNTAVGATRNAVVTVDALSSLRGKVYTTASVCNVKLPSYKIPVLIILLLPVIILNAMAIPKIMDARALRLMYRDECLEAQGNIEEALNTYFDTVRSSDCTKLREGHRADTSGSFRELEGKYVMISIDQYGTISDISYHLMEDTSMSREANVNEINTFIKEVSDVLNKYDLNVDQSLLSKYSSVPDDFVDEYIHAEANIDVLEFTVNTDVDYNSFYYYAEADSDDAAYFSYVITFYVE